jgi:glycosyltransferase involved in cell wall biosynthesis
MHLEYLEHLMLASPCRQQEPPQDAKPLFVDHSQFEIIELPPQRSFFHSLKVMPIIVYRLWKAIRRANIVHSGIVGWPIPMGWIVTPMVLLLRKPFVIIVESAPWRMQKELTIGWKARLRSSLYEFMGQLIVRRANLAIFTQDEYRQSMLGKDASRGHVIPASWIDEKDILSDLEAQQEWKKKLARRDSRLSILFVGRLAPEKGVLVLLDSLRRLGDDNFPIRLDILGEGVLKKECEALASELKGMTSVRVLGTVPYGPPLFALIRDYDAVVIPSVTDEQPRIVFDAYSQGVPVFASDTAGLRSCVRSGETGLLFPPNDVTALVALLLNASIQRQELKQLGINSLKCAHEMTHQEMHRQRSVLLKHMLDARTRTLEA